MQPEPTSARDNRQRALRETLGISLVMFVITGAAIFGVWVAASQAIERVYRNHLTNLALAAALQVDPDLHRSLKDPDQGSSAEYQYAIAPLRRMRLALPEVRHLYTVTRGTDGQVHYVLDATDAFGHVDDEESDQASVWQILQDVDATTEDSLGNGANVGQAAATSKPTADHAGDVMTGMAPLVDDSGDQYGAIGVSVDSSRFVAQLHQARFWAVIGLLPATLLTVLFGLTYYRVRRRGLSAAAEARVNAEVLRQEREHLASVIDATRAGTWEAVVDPERASSYVITVDSCWADMVGRPLQELNPLTPERLFPLLVHPDDAPVARAAIDNALREEGSMFSVDLRLRHTDGRWVWAEVRGKVIERDRLGRPLRMVGTQLDITARKQAELALLNSEHEFRTLFEGAPISICLFDRASGRFLKVNNAMAATTGYSRDELLRMTYWDVTPSEYHAASQQASMGLENGSSFGPHEIEYQRRDGSRFPVVVSGTCHADPSGHEVGWAIVQDITERKATERALTEATSPKLAAR